MDLKTYGRLAGLQFALPEAEHEALFVREGVAREALTAAWGPFAQQMSEDAAATTSYTAAFRAGLTEATGDVRDLTEEEYRKAEVFRRLQRPPETGELSAAEFLLAQYRFMDTLNANKRAMMRMEAHVLLETHAALGMVTLHPLPPPSLATRVRERRCPFCDAPKYTVPRVPQVYCDHCAGLMDYDHAAARMTTQGVDPAFITATLLEGVRDELRAAWGRDDKAWAEAWRWVYETDMALCPAGWSPRITQADYREALLTWSIETCRVANRPEVKAANARASEAMEAAAALNGGWAEVDERRAHKAIKKHLAASDAALGVLITVYAAEGLFASHPDDLTPDTFCRMHRGGLVQQWRPWLDDDKLAVVRAHVDAAEVWLALAAVDLERSACGGCGGPLLVVPGSTALVCEGCGLRLDARQPRFPCPNCAAAVVVVPNAHEITCGHCSVVFLPG